MTTIKSSDVDRTIANPDPVQSIFLVFGPDTGLVRERADARLLTIQVIPSLSLASKAMNWRATRRGS